MLRSIGSKRINLWYVECLLTDHRMGRIQGSLIVLVEGAGVWLVRVWYEDQSHVGPCEVKALRL